jgi:branched-chain amino acid transport system permease protein
VTLAAVLSEHRLVRRGITRGVVMAAGAAVLVVLAVTNGSGNPLTITNVLGALIAGIALGAIYSLAATGLVVTYTTSGIFNFAQGAIGMLMAFIYWQLTQPLGIGQIPALLLVVLIIAPLTGVLLERFVMRGAARGSLVVQLMMTVALTVFLMGLAAWIWNQNEGRTIPFLFNGLGLSLGTTFVPWHRALTIGLGVVVAIALRLFLQRSRLGLAMRAVVDNPALAGLHGARPEQASALAWAISSALAALAGILIAPEVLMSVEGLTLLIVNAFAAAIIGRLRSLPMTVGGGLLIGLLTSFTLSFVNTSGRWTGLPEAIPTIVLFVALLLFPSAPIVAGRRQQRVHVGVPALGEAALGALLLVLLVAFGTLAMPTTTQNFILTGVTTGLVLLPLVPLIGWAGQVALAPLTFAGIGAWVMRDFASNGNLLGLLGGAILALPFGIAMALPAIRLEGLYFALASVAFARAMELLFFPQPDVLANSSIIQRPTLLGVSFQDTHSFLVLTTGLLGMEMVALVALRRSAFGRRLVAMRDSTAACTMAGLDIRRLKLVVFCLSASLGAIGGGVVALQQGTPTADEFTMFGGLTATMYLVLGGVALVTGALFAGGAGALFSWLTTTFPSGFMTAFNRIGPAGLASGMSRNPDGIAGQIGRDVGRLLPWRRQAQAGVQRQPRLDPSRLGIDEPFSEAALRAIDAHLALPASLRPGR